MSVLVVKNSRQKLLHAVDVAQFNAQYANSLTVKMGTGNNQKNPLRLCEARRLIYPALEGEGVRNA